MTPPKSATKDEISELHSEKMRNKRLRRDAFHKRRNTPEQIVSQHKKAPGSIATATHKDKREIARRLRQDGKGQK